MSLRFLSLLLLIYLSGLYFLELFGYGPKHERRQFLNWGCLLISLLLVTLPPFWKSYVIYLTQAYLIIIIGMLLWTIFRDHPLSPKKFKVIIYTGIFAAAFILTQVFNFYENYSIHSTQTYALFVLTLGMGFLALLDINELNTERNQLTTDLQSANQELSGLTKSLEKKVAQRTVELADRNQELEALQRFRQRTNAMIIHDLKNPLQVILSRSKAGTDQRIQSAGRRMLLMIQNMLDVDRAEQAQLIVRKENLVLTDIIQDAVERQQGFITEKAITVNQAIPSHDKIIADRVLAERIVDNILHNAIKYSPSGGHIRLHTKYPEGFVALYCDDTGPGVAEELREQIFLDYNTNRAQADAHGLGLSFVKTALEAIGGLVKVATPDNGLGARFILFFPVVPQEPDHAVLLNNTTWELLTPYLPQLQQTKCYAATTIESILDKIPETKELRAWKQAVRVAMYAGDETAYQQLLRPPV